MIHTNTNRIVGSHGILISITSIALVCASFWRTRQLVHWETIIESYRGGDGRLVCSVCSAWDARVSDLHSSPGCCTNQSSILIRIRFFFLLLKVNDVPKVWPLTLFTLCIMVNVELRSKEC